MTRPVQLTTGIPFCIVTSNSRASERRTAWGWTLFLDSSLATPQQELPMNVNTRSIWTPGLKISFTVTLPPTPAEKLGSRVTTNSFPACNTLPSLVRSFQGKAISWL